MLYLVCDLPAPQACYPRTILPRVFRIPVLALHFETSLPLTSLPRVSPRRCLALPQPHITTVSPCFDTIHYINLSLSLCHLYVPAFPCLYGVDRLQIFLVRRNINDATLSSNERSSLTLDHGGSGQKVRAVQEMVIEH